MNNQTHALIYNQESTFYRMGEIAARINQAAGIVQNNQVVKISDVIAFNDILSQVKHNLTVCQQTISMEVKANSLNEEEADRLNKVLMENRGSIPWLDLPKDEGVRDFDIDTPYTPVQVDMFEEVNEEDKSNDQ